jgi:hypothetical protein
MLVGASPIHLGATPLLARRNILCNERFENAAPGSPGTMPSLWQSFFFNQGTVAQTVVGTGSTGGRRFIDIRLAGTAGTGGGWVLNARGGYARQGHVLDWRLRIARIDGSTANLSFAALQLITKDRAFANTNIQQGSNFVGNITASLDLFNFQTAMSSALAEQVESELVITFDNGAAIDVTLRFASPELVRLDADET